MSLKSLLVCMNGDVVLAGNQVYLGGLGNTVVRMSAFASIHACNVGIIQPDVYAYTFIETGCPASSHTAPAIDCADCPNYPSRLAAPPQAILEPPVPLS